MVGVLAVESFQGVVSKYKIDFSDYVNLLSSDEDSDLQEALEASLTSGNQSMTHERYE